MKKEVFKRLSEKLKTDKKTRAAVITSAVGAVIVLAAAITIPVTLHNRAKVEADAESAAITAEAVVTESASVVVTEPETETVSEISAEPTTAETTAQAASKNTSSGKNTPVDTNKGGSANKNGGSDSSAKKPNSGSSGVQSQQKPPAAEQPKDDKYNWTQADVDAAVAEARQYARNRGLVIDSSLTASGTSWMNPVDTRLDSKTRVNSDLHYQIENSLTGISDELIEAGIVTINIFSVNCGSYWEIYVVY